MLSLYKDVKIMNPHMDGCGDVLLSTFMCYSFQLEN